MPSNVDNVLSGLYMGINVDMILYTEYLRMDIFASMSITIVTGVYASNSSQMNCSEIISVLHSPI